MERKVFIFSSKFVEGESCLIPGIYVLSVVGNTFAVYVYTRAVLVYIFSMIVRVPGLSLVSQVTRVVMFSSSPAFRGSAYQRIINPRKPCARSRPRGVCTLYNIVDGKRPIHPLQVQQFGIIMVHISRSSSSNGLPADMKLIADFVCDDTPLSSSCGLAIDANCKEVLAWDTRGSPLPSRLARALSLATCMYVCYLSRVECHYPFRAQMKRSGKYKVGLSFKAVP